MKIQTKMLVLTTLSSAACSVVDSIETRVATALGQSCPPADPSDQGARDRGADALTNIDELRTSMTDPFYWGNQGAGTTVEGAIEDSHVTDFNPLVWRRMYLSTYMFDGPGTV